MFRDYFLKRQQAAAIKKLAKEAREKIASAANKAERIKLLEREIAYLEGQCAAYRSLQSVPATTYADLHGRLYEKKVRLTQEKS
jgi:hypothetical protein